MSTPTHALDTVCTAYDGSVNAHWVVRYALAYAATTPSRTLRLVHVEDGQLSTALFERKVEHITAECARAGVEAVLHPVRARGPVAEAVLDAVPPGRRSLLLCGIRARPRHARFLPASVPHALLAHPRCNVLALRVVSPGLLGTPRRVLLPVAGKPGEGRAAALLLAPFLPGLERLHLLRVMLTDAEQARHASAAAMARLRGPGHAAVTYVEQELRAAADPGDAHVDAHVRIAASWARPAIVLAGQYRCGLVLAGASPRALARRDSELEVLLANAPCDVGLHVTAP